ncbi:MAG: hypothetical protein ACE5EG_03295 [Thermoanaerobaculia bacterium]
MTSSGLDPHDQEMIAAFIERRLSEEERRAFMKRLDDEEALYEVFVETVRYRDQEAGGPATVIEHPASRRRWGRPATVAAVVSLAVATPVVLLNLPGRRYAPRLVADGLLDTILEEGWYVKRWSVTRGPGPGIGGLATAFRLGVRHVDLEVALGFGRSDDAAILATELGLLLESIALSEPLQVRYTEVGQLAGEAERALRLAEQNEPLLVASLGDDAAAYELGKWTEAGVLAARSGNLDLLGARSYRRSLGGFPRDDWPELAARLDEIEGLLGTPQDRLDLAKLERAFTAIIDRT